MIQVLVEERYRDNIRFNDAFEGFKSAVLARKESYVILKNKKDFDPKERVLVIFGIRLNWIGELFSFCHERNIHPLIFGFSSIFLILLRLVDEPMKLVFPLRYIGAYDSTPVLVISRRTEDLASNE